MTEQAFDYPPIVERVIRNDVETVRRMLDDGASPVASYPAGLYQVGVGKFSREPGEWPLCIFAAKHGAAGTLALLLERGASVPAEHAEGVLSRIAGSRPPAAALQVVTTLLAAHPTLAKSQAADAALCMAASGASRPVLEALLHAGVRIDARDADGSTVLHRLIGRYVMPDAIAVLPWLLERGAPLDVADAKGDRPLAVALRAGSFMAALLLLRAGSPGEGRLTRDVIDRLEAAVERARAIPSKAPPTDLFGLARAKAWAELVELGEVGMPLDVQPLSGEQPWTSLLNGAPLELQIRALPLVSDTERMLRSVAYRAVDANGLARLEAALSLGLDLNPPARPSEWIESTVLGQALSANAPPEVFELLVARGASVNGVAGRFSPAHDAARHLRAIAWLAERGGELDRSIEKHGTPLQLAVERGWDDAAHLLVERGVRVDVKDAAGRTPLMRATERGAKKALIDALAARMGVDTPELPRVEVRRVARGPLARACERGDAAEARRLVAAGADPDARDERGSTPLAIAAALDRATVVAALLELGAKPDTPTRDGLRPWPLAKLLHARSAEKLLEDAGARTTPVLLIETGNVLERYATLISRSDLPGLGKAIEAGMDVDLPLIGGRRPLEKTMRDEVRDLLTSAGAELPEISDDAEPSR